MRTIETKDVIGIVLTVWANIVATIALIHELKKDKKKTANHRRPKHMKKR